MPTYDYNCPKCGHFETWQSIKDNALAVCPTCGSKVERLISANIGFVLKGSGFYQNDYKKKAPAKTKKKVEAKAETKTTGSPDTCCGGCGDAKSCTAESN